MTKAGTGGWIEGLCLWRGSNSRIPLFLIMQKFPGAECAEKVLPCNLWMGRKVWIWMIKVQGPKGNRADYHSITRPLGGGLGGPSNLRESFTRHVIPTSFRDLQVLIHQISSNINISTQRRHSGNSVPRTTTFTRHSVCHPSTKYFTRIGHDRTLGDSKKIIACLNFI